VRLEPSRREFSEEERAHQNIEAKKVISRLALGHIRAGQTILFDASTTVRQLAEMLPDQPLTAITNGIRTALILTQKPAIDVVLLGGNIHNNSLSCAGDAAELALDLIHIDAAFLSCRGFDVSRGPSEASEGQARLKRRVFERADKVFLLADASKIGVSSSYFFARPSEISALITDQEPDSKILSALKAAGVEILIPHGAGSPSKA
jgi:DeoR/GlpR family transcriptional regulator of sugar metabolism